MEDVHINLDVENDYYPFVGEIIKQVELQNDKEENK